MKKNQEENNILWKIAGFKRDIIEDCKVDGHHAVMIGILLIIVGIYASIAWYLFFLSVVRDSILAILLGIFMGFFIFSLDRALISSLAKVKQTISLRFSVSAGFRILLALLIGYVLAEPVVNAIYHREIDREAQVLISEKNRELKEKLDTEYVSEIETLINRKTNYKNEINSFKEVYLNASGEFSKEMDGTGGSGHIGYKEIAKKKEKILLDNKKNYETQLETIQPKIDDIDRRLAEIENQKKIEYEEYKKKTVEIGPLLKSEALQSLKDKDKSNTLKYKHWLLLAILTLIELSAFIIKLIYSTNSYSDKIENINLEEQNLHRINKEITMKRQKVYRKEAAKKEKELILKFFKHSQRVNKKRLSELFEEWKAQKYNLNDLWRKFKDNFGYYKY